MQHLTRSKRVKRRWTGDATDLDRLCAGRDPRQTHFAFYVQPDLSAGTPDPGKKQPSSASVTSPPTLARSPRLERSPGAALARSSKA